MLTTCEKCGTNAEAKLDVEKDQVLCMECGTVIDINKFMKAAMKTRGDIIKRDQITIPPNGLKYFCDKKECGKPFSAEVDPKDDKVYCPHCGSAAKITFIAVNLLKEYKIFKGYTEAYFADEDIHNRANNEQIEKAINSGGPAIVMNEISAEKLPNPDDAEKTKTKTKKSTKKVLKKA
jgi:DNA-directed RNA polymerase subunit RPC12/RpoP